MINHDSSTQPDPARVRRIVLTVVLLVAASVVVAWLLYTLRPVILLLAFASHLCYLIAPMVDFVERPFRLRLEVTQNAGDCNSLSAAGWRNLLIADYLYLCCLIRSARSRITSRLMLSNWINR